MITEPSLPMTLFCILTLATFVAYDRLVRRQYDVARDAWERDGKPPGFAWWPREASPMRSWPRTKAAFRLLVETPAWIGHDDRARTLHRQFRRLWLASAAAWLWFVTLIIAGA